MNTRDPKSALINTDYDEGKMTNKENMIEIETVASNCDNSIAAKVKKELLESPNKKYAQHAAWDFCGYIWHNGKHWVEQIWVHKSVSAEFCAETIKIVTEKAEYGYD